MARPLGSPNKDKPFRDALRMEIKAAGDDNKELREVAKTLIARAKSGDVPAIKEVADRLDGKVPQAHIGGDEGDNPLVVETVAPREMARAVLGLLREANLDEEKK